MLTRTGAAPPDAAVRARAHLDAARAEARGGSLRRAWSDCLSAAAIARTLQDPELMAEAATAIGEPSVMWKSAGARQALCLEALGMLGEAPEDDTEPVDRKQWRELVRTHLNGLSTGWAERMTATSPPIDRRDAQRRFAALQTAYLTSLGVDGLSQRLAVAYDSIRLGRTVGDDHIVAWGWHWRADALAQLGLRVDFNHAIGELSAVADRIASPMWTWRLDAIRANIALLDGRLADVPVLADRARDAGRLAETDDAELFDLVLRGALAQRTRVGLDAVEAKVRVFIADAPLFAQGWRAEILLAMGRVDEAVEIHRTLIAHLDDIPADIHEWLVAHVASAELAVAADDRVAALRILNRLQPYAHLHAAGPVTTPYGGPIALPLAKLAAFLGRREESHRYAADAVARADAMGASWHAASARALVGSDRSPLAPLSRREGQVARLVADARTNREIAVALFLSERTVEQHVRNILHKLGFSNRAAIAAWVARSQRP